MEKNYVPVGIGIVLGGFAAYVGSNPLYIMLIGVCFFLYGMYRFILSGKR